MQRMVLDGLASEQISVSGRRDTISVFYMGTANVRMPCTIENHTKTRSFLKNETRIPTEFPVKSTFQEPLPHSARANQFTTGQIKRPVWLADASSSGPGDWRLL